VARKVGSTNKYSAPRLAGDGTTFGVWSAWSPSGLTSSHEDFSFYLVGGKEHVLTAEKVSSTKRALNDCLLPSGGAALCTPLNLSYAKPPPFNDVDGPAIAHALATPELVFNLNDPSGGVLIYWAVQSAPGTFAAAEVPVSLAGSRDDDPTISPEGSVVVFGSNRPGGLGGYDLWITRHQPGTSVFSPPTPGQGQLNSTKDEAGPDLARVTVAGSQVLELYFSSNRSGAWVVYRAACKLK